MMNLQGICQTLPQLNSTLLKFGVTKAVTVPAASLHTSELCQSRIKKTARHKPMWHIKKLNKAIDEPMIKENKLFVQEVLNDQYAGPLKSELAPWSRGTWEPWTRRCGVLGVKIGVQPLWLKNGKMITTTMLHVVDNHVVKFIPRALYDESYKGQMDQRPCFTGPGKKKGPNVHGYIIVGSHSTDPQKYTKDYCGLFTDAGLMPKRFLGRFPITGSDKNEEFYFVNHNFFLFSAILHAELCLCNR